MKKSAFALFALTLGGLISAASLTTAAPARPEAEGAWYDVDTTHSTIVFRIEHLGVSAFYGRLNDPAGRFHFDASDPAACSFDIRAKADNIDTGHARRDGHLKSADFFNAKEFPDLGFQSTQVSRKGDRTYEVTGRLTVHGETRPVTATLDFIGEGESPFGDYRCGFDGRFTINRSEFGIDYMPGGLGEQVTIMVGLEGVRKKD